jgi:hypothetical protein
MSKRKLFALLVSGAVMMALGISCIPNIGGTFTLAGILNMLGLGGTTG